MESLGAWPCWLHAPKSILQLEYHAEGDGALAGALRGCGLEGGMGMELTGCQQGKVPDSPVEPVTVAATSEHTFVGQGRPCNLAGAEWALVKLSWGRKRGRKEDRKGSGGRAVNGDERQEWRKGRGGHGERQEGKKERRAEERERKEGIRGGRKSG